MVSMDTPGRKAFLGSTGKTVSKALLESRYVVTLARKVTPGKREKKAILARLGQPEQMLLPHVLGHEVNLAGGYQKVYR
jgi:hypothetical protein